MKCNYLSKKTFLIYIDKYIFTKSKDVHKYLNFFIANNLEDYSANRNYDLGPPHHNVSKLSPYISEDLFLKPRLSI